MHSGGGEQALRQLGEIVRRIWPAAQIHLFGSQATGLALPGSDLDFVILGASPIMQNAAQGFSAYAPLPESLD
jgi:DNA polymerase sigma